MSLMRRTGNAVTGNPFGVDAAPTVPIDGLLYRGDDAAVSFLAKELGVEIQNQRNHAHITALQNPAQWLDGYNNRLRVVLTKLGKDLKDRTANYAQLYPMDQAVALAQRDIALVFEIEKRQLDIEYPGSDLLFKQAEKDQFIKFNENGGVGMLNAVARDAKADKAAYKRYKKYKKSKKPKSESA